MTKVETIESGCPICGSDVKGSEKFKFYCKKCNILFDRPVPEPRNNGPAVARQPAKPEDLKYVGSSQSKRYHLKDCRYVRQIDYQNKLYFKTKEDAKGYLPCICVRKNGA